MSNGEGGWYDALAEQPVTSVAAEIHGPNGRAPGADPAPAQEGDGYRRPYASERLNSRVAAALGAGIWETAWKADVSGGLQTPAFVLQSGNRIVVQGAFQWQLFDTGGTALAVGGLGPGDVVIDETGGAFYVPEPSGLVSAHNLADGKPVFSMNAFAGDAFRRAQLVRRDKDLLVVSIEDKVQPHGAHTPSLSAVEVYEVGSKPRVNEFGLAADSRVKARLTHESVLLHTAVAGDTLVLATRGRIDLADSLLKIIASFEGSFIPLALSLDEAGRLYLIVRAADSPSERTALWLLTPEGERLYDTTLPVEMDIVHRPPIVGYDHTVYILLEEEVLAVGSDGRIRWRQHAGGPIAGAVATADNRLLVAAGPVASAIDEAGERQVLFFQEGERWATPPILTPEGHMLVASERSLYALRPQP